MKHLKNILPVIITYLLLTGCSLFENENPKVLFSNPSPGETDVDEDRNIIITFSKEIDPQKCISAFSIQPNPGGLFQCAGRELIFTPSGNWDLGTTYIFSINQRCEDTEGRDLNEPYYASFAIGSDIAPPSLIEGQEMTGDLYPACAGAGLTTVENFQEDVCYDMEGLQLRFNFNEPMDSAKTSSAFSIFPVVEYSIFWVENTMVFSLKEDLQRDTMYKVQIDTKAADINNNSIESDFIRYFKTAGDGDSPYVTDVLSDFANGSGGCDGNVDDSIVGNNISDVCTDNSGSGNEARFRVDFNEEMDPSFTKDAFSISPNVDGGITMIENNTQLLFISNEALAPAVLYKITIDTDARDIEGNNLENPYVLFFETTNLNGYPAVSSIVVRTGGIYPVCGGIETDILSDNVTDACEGDPSVNPIVVNFSEPMNQIETESAFSISPSMEGIFTWNGAGTALTFTPDTNFDYGERYTVEVSTSATDLQDQSMQSAVKGDFIVVEDDAVEPSSDDILTCSITCRHYNI